MKDFDSFTSDKTAANSGGMDKSVFSYFSSLAAKYEGKSGDELIKAILKEAEKGRKNGTLTDADIDNFAATLSPMLNDKQRKILDGVVKKLKN